MPFPTAQPLSTTQRPARVDDAVGRSATAGGRDRLSVAPIAALVLLSTMIVVTTSIGGGGAVDRAGVRSLFEEAPSRLRLAAVVIAAAVRDLGAPVAGDELASGTDLSTTLALLPSCLDALRSAPPDLVRAADRSLPPIPADPLRDALLSLPPPKA